MLIVPCGCRGRALAASLAEAGHAVRGTTRSQAGAEAIRAAGAEPYVGDPDRIGTLMDALAGVTIVCWLMGTVPVPELHEGRLRMLWEKLVDTPVRGVVYEGALPQGEQVARTAAQTWQIPLEVLDARPARPRRLAGRRARRGRPPAGRLGGVPASRSTRKIRPGAGRPWDHRSSSAPYRTIATGRVSTRRRMPSRDGRPSRARRPASWRSNAVPATRP